MFEQILKHRPEGATHWQAGTYYKNDVKDWYYWGRYGSWHLVGNIADLNFLCMSKLPDEEIAAGHRIDKPSNPRELETLDKPENHISPNCQSRDV